MLLVTYDGVPAGMLISLASRDGRATHLRIPSFLWTPSIALPKPNEKVPSKSTCLVLSATFEGAREAVRGTKSATGAGY